MTASKTSTTPRHAWPSSRAQKPSTTPQAVAKAHTPASVGQNHAPRLTPSIKSPTKQQNNPRAPSPSYFGLAVDGAGPNANPVESATGHVKKNWKSPSSSIQSKMTPKSPAPVPNESNPEYEEFRKQSEAYAFNLSQRNFSGLTQYVNATPSSPLAKNEPMKNASVRAAMFDTDETISPMQTVDVRDTDRMDIDSGVTGRGQQKSSQNTGSFFDQAPNETRENAPSLMRDRLSHIDERHPRLSLPQNRVSQDSPALAIPQRAETLPSSLSKDGPSMVDPQKLENLLDGSRSKDVLLLDLRVSPQFMQSKLKGALNLCIPTTLLKRPSFNLQRLTDTFTDKAEKATFGRWKEVKYIIVYDASSATLKDAVTCVNTIKKFTTEGWQGLACIVKGGFQATAKALPHLVEKANSGPGSDAAMKLSLQSGNGVMPVAGGCPMPVTKSAANPFFGNIRQNMDLIGGVGQVSLKLPESLGHRGFEALPAWLRTAAQEDDKGKAVSNLFLQLEKDELSRMQKALSGNVSYGTPGPDVKKSIQVAGIEKGSKNRYKDMLPYDHTRVKLQGVEQNGCDYVNASHIKAEWSNKRYIATQAPIPATFEDFWRVVWEQDVRVLVMLTAETEGAQRKCHPYWLSGDYGPMKVHVLSEKRVSLQQPNTLASNLKKSALGSPSSKPSTPSRRRATTAHGAAAADAARDSTPAAESPSEPSHITVRNLTLSHGSFPFKPMREIVQIQYTQWPDFGTPAHASDLLGIVEHTNTFARQYRDTKTNPQLPASESEPPIIVHCSAGCGRTGTFCTIDSVIDMLKRQKIRRLAEAGREREDMEIDTEDEDGGDDTSDDDGEGGSSSGGGEGADPSGKWETSDDIDLVKQAVEDFRLQRISMVQTLKQFVLCYEAVLEWLVKESPERYKRDGMRRSFHG